MLLACLAVAVMPAQGGAGLLDLLSSQNRGHGGGNGAPVRCGASARTGIDVVLVAQHPIERARRPARARFACRDVLRVEVRSDLVNGPVFLHQEAPAETHAVHLTVPAGSVYGVCEHKPSALPAAFDAQAVRCASAHPGAAL